MLPIRFGQALLLASFASFAWRARTHPLTDVRAMRISYSVPVPNSANPYNAVAPNPGEAINLL
jgi:hypothetical protein